jgi:YggT family protein
MRVIFSWMGFNPENPIHIVVHEITEPILAPIRRYLPRVGMIDLSPMAAMFLLIIMLNAANRIF